HWKRCHAGGSHSNRKGRLCRRGIVHYGRRSRRCTGAGARPTGHQRRLGVGAACQAKEGYKIVAAQIRAIVYSTLLPSKRDDGSVALLPMNSNKMEVRRPIAPKKRIATAW